MAGDLENAVRGCINDRLARADMLVAVILNYFGAGIGKIAEYIHAVFAAEGICDLLRKAVRICGERPFGYYPRDLPMADRRVLSAAQLRGGGIHAHGGSDRILLFVGAVDVEQTDPCEVFELRRSRHHAAERIGTEVAEIGGIVRVSDPKAVEHNKKNAFIHKIPP